MVVANSPTPSINPLALTHASTNTAPITTPATHLQLLVEPPERRRQPRGDHPGPEDVCQNRQSVLVRARVLAEAVGVE